MAQKADLEARESACSSAEEFAQLAAEALADPADNDYAKELLGKAEMQCQFPIDYVKTAEGFVALGDTDYAKDLYEQAEEACFEGHEFGEVGFSVAKHLGDKEKGKELLDKAADEAKEVADFLKLAQYAEQGLGDSEMAKTYFAKVEEQCKTIDDFKTLAKGIAADDVDSAKTLYQKAERFCDDVPATVNYAQGAMDIFDDKEWAGKILGDAETDCQFPQDFVDLAAGFKSQLGDTDKVGELLEQGADFAMSGEEHLALAKGYWDLLQDKEKAAESYQKVVDDQNDREKLLELAKTIATDVGDKEIAKKAYAKVESKTASAMDLGKLAQAVCDDLDDKEYASEIYGRAEEKLKGANDLINLSGEVLKNLDDKDRAAGLYQKALAATNDFGGCAKLLNVVQDKLPDNKDLARSIITQAESSAEATPEYLELADKSVIVLDDKDMAKAQLHIAEERVTSLDEMRKLAKAVEKHFGDDAEWKTQVAEKLEKREANQAKYSEFQDRENACTNNAQFLNLVDQVMEELEDKFYARKLLTAAEKTLESQTFNLNNSMALGLSVDRHLQDSDWVKRIFDACAEKCQTFACMRNVGQGTASLTDKALGQSLAKSYYGDFEAKVDGAESKSTYDYSKLVTAVSEDLGDAGWAKQLLSKAAAQNGDHFALAHLAQLANSLGDSSTAESLFNQSAAACKNPSQFIQLGQRLRTYNLAGNQLKALYGQGLGQFEAARDQLQLAEGIMDVFNDKAWATEVYAQMADKFSSEEDKALYQASLSHNVERTFF